MINKAKMQEQSHANVELTESPQVPVDTLSVASNREVTETSQVTWSGAHIALQFYQASHLRDVILLDSESSTSIFCNPSFVMDIYETNEVLELLTNRGPLKMNLKATVPGFGLVWFDSDSIANIFALADMEDKYQVTYDSSKESALIVHLLHKTIKFCRSAGKLYCYKLDYNTRNSDCRNNKFALVNTVEENKLAYTNHQFECAKKAQELYHALGTPSISDFKAIIHMNVIKNNPITLEDIKIAKNIFGLDVGSLKGKTTHTKPLPVVSDYVEIPQELIAAHHQVTLCMDTMIINGLAFLTMISRNIQYRTAEFIPSLNMESYRSALDHVLQVYKHAGLSVVKLHCDNEYHPLEDTLMDKQVWHQNELFKRPRACAGGRTQQSCDQGMIPCYISLTAIQETPSNYDQDSSHGVCQETQLLSSQGWCL